MSLAEIEKIQSRDYLRYGNPNNICYEIARGRISPWMLYQSESAFPERNNCPKYLTDLQYLAWSFIYLCQLP